MTAETWIGVAELILSNVFLQHLKHFLFEVFLSNSQKRHTHIHTHTDKHKKVGGGGWAKVPVSPELCQSP